MNDPASEYQQFLTDDEANLNRCWSLQKKLVFVRFASFISIVLPFFIFSTPWSTVIAVFALSIFLFSVRKSVQIDKRQKLLRRLSQTERNEIRAFSHQYDQFDAGKEFINPEHPFSYDLDVYEEGGLFQFLNRTASPLGKKQLAAYLDEPELDIQILKDRKSALEELGGKVRWRLMFAALGNLNNEKDLKLFREFDGYKLLKHPKRLKWMITIIPVISISALFLLLTGIIPWIIFLLLLLFNTSLLGFSVKTIDAFYNHYGNQAEILTQYQLLINHIEKESFQSPLLNKLKKGLSYKNATASQLINELQKIVARFDYRKNFVFIMVADPLLLWDFLCVYQLYRWQQNYHKLLADWIDILARFDALCSLANYNYNHRGNSLPEFVDGEFCYVSSNMAHPLLHPKVRISNDFSMAGNGKMVILTGANMAGKSTFLRTLGINLVLALNGCRVCASAMKVKPVQLFSNMRTTDNLMKSESYFHAELKRLKQILTEIENGAESFILIDEMLKGTNSIDKLEGSKALTNRLIKLQTNGIISTHDLKLTELHRFSPDDIQTLCFEISIKNDILEFDYKLKNGVTSTLNAEFLMRMMGIIPTN